MCAVSDQQQSTELPLQVPPATAPPAPCCWCGGLQGGAAAPRQQQPPAGTTTAAGDLAALATTEPDGVQKHAGFDSQVCTGDLCNAGYTILFTKGLRFATPHVSSTAGIRHPTHLCINVIHLLQQHQQGHLLSTNTNQALKQARHRTHDRGLGHNSL